MSTIKLQKREQLFWIEKPFISRDARGEDVAIRSYRGLFADEVKNLTLDNVTIRPAEGAAMELVQVEHINIQ